MKKIILIAALALSALSASAQWNPPPGNPMPPMPGPVWPSVYNWGSHAELRVSNPNQNFVWCTGTISMYMDGPDNRVHRANVSLNVYPRGYATQRYTPASAGRIRNISHNVWCR